MTDIDLSNIKYALERYGITDDITQYKILEEEPDNLTLAIDIRLKKYLFVADDSLSEDTFYEQQAKAELNSSIRKIKLLKSECGDNYNSMVGPFMMCKLYELKPL